MKITNQDVKSINGIRIFTVKDVMEIMGIGRDKAYALFRAKSFPATRLGRQAFVTESNFNDWLNNNAGRTINI